MRLAAIILLLAALTGCSYATTGLSVVKEKGANAADISFQAGKEFICNGVTVGAVRRNVKDYGSYNGFCAEPGVNLKPAN